MVKRGVVNRGTLHRLAPLLGLVLFGLALWVLRRELHSYHIKDILAHLKDMPSPRLGAGCALTVLSYMMMTGYDVLALYYVTRPLSYGRIALASFIGYAFSNNIGLSMVAGGSVRYRLYSAWGLSALEITEIVAFCTITLWLGFLALGGLVFLAEPLAIPGALHLPFVSARPLGGLFLLLVVCYLIAIVIRKKPLTIRGWEFPIPSIGLFGGQLTLAFLDWALAGSVLYMLLGKVEGLTYLGFLGMFLLGQLAGLISQLPGGIGVFETVMILLLTPLLPASQIAGSLLAYRGIYYLLPLLVATALLGTQELLQKKESLATLGRVFGRFTSSVVPPAMTFMTLVGGAILLLSGATPAVASRLNWLNDFLPLPVMEISHFLGSLAGAGLVLLAWGLQRRIDVAYIFTTLFLGAGILFSLLKGLDYEEAFALSLMLGALLPCRRYFYRKASLIGERFRPGWIAAVAIVMGASLWLGFFSYKHVEYSGDLWWKFTLHGDAPRFLRATVGATGLLFFFALARLLRPAAPLQAGSIEPVNIPDLVPSIVRNSPRTYANLALLGDKRFLFGQKGDALIMYGVEGRSWVAMGDPIGPEEEWAELLWNFRAMVDRYDGWTVFYEVGPERLHLYLDLGLTLLKLGQEARVPLQNFSLEGGPRKGLRYTARKLEKEGCVFQVIPRDQVPSLLPQLKGLSDAWLKEKSTGEKGFSLGFFHEEYLKHFPAGIVKKEGKIVAFANLWPGGKKEELSIDLMRHLSDAPHGVMEYLFIQLMLWGKQEGYRWFNLGMAPFSGLEDHGLAPLWSRAGAYLFRHGEHFYNFQGLRQYKEKFNPRWTPKYLACPGGLAVPRILANMAVLVSGGLKGVLAK